MIWNRTVGGREREEWIGGGDWEGEMRHPFSPPNDRTSPGPHTPNDQHQHTNEPTTSAPRFTNRDDLDFGTANAMAPLQEFELQESNPGGVLEYPTQ